MAVIYQEAKSSTEIDSNWFTYFTVGWLDPLIFLGSKRPLVADKSVSSAALSEHCRPYWAAYRDADEANIPKPDYLLFLSRLHFWKFMAIFVMSVVETGASTYLIQLLVDQAIGIFNNSSELPLPLLLNGYAVGFILFSLQIAMASCKSYINNANRRLTLILHAQISTAIFQKRLRLSPRSANAFSTGHVIHLATTDCENLAAIMPGLLTHAIKFGQICLSFVLLSSKLGLPATLASFSLAILSAFATIGLGPSMRKLSENQMQHTDSRITKTREALIGFRILKFRALEHIIEKSILALRATEIRCFIPTEMILWVTQSFALVLGDLMPLIAISVYLSYGNLLDPQVIFPSIIIFQSLVQSLSGLSHTVQHFVAIKIFRKRVKTFLEAHEQENNECSRKEDSCYAVELQGMVWGYDHPTEKQETLFEVGPINLGISHGKLVGVIGSVGSGKSSLLRGLVGDISENAGTRHVYGNVSFCSQQPWISSGSIRANIVFSSPVNDGRLRDVITAVCLENDLKIFPDGIETEIGENGINLSGGQKARIALARALYRQADIYLIDDVISSVDTEMAGQIFQRAIQTFLKGKTVLFVTQRESMIKRVDSILLMKKGIVAEYCKPDSLLVTPEVLVSTAKAETTQNFICKDTISKRVTEFIKPESTETGSVPRVIYKVYLQAVGPLLLTIVIFFSITAVIAFIWNDVYLSSATSREQIPTNFLLFYSTLSISKSIAFTFTFGIILKGVLQASSVLHNQAMAGLLNTTTDYIDRQPVGRILNTMSADVESCDNELSNVFVNTILTFLSLVSTLAVIAISSWYMLPFMALLGGAYVMLFNYYQKSNRELKRLTSTIKSPLDSHISEFLAGISTFRAYSLGDVQLSKYHTVLDDFAAVNFLKDSIELWLSYRINILVTLLTLFIVLIGTALPSSIVFKGAFGLALTSSVVFSRGIYVLFYYLCEGEAEMNAVERLHEFGNHLPREAEYHLSEDPPLSLWPLKGEIQFVNVTLAYSSRPDTPSVNSASFSVKAGEHVGIVGHSGAGKSTLIMGLFRLMELSHGSILIDDIGLHTVRRGMQMIPQDPILFEGTLRFNLDPENVFSDREIWTCLSRVGMHDFVANANLKLEMALEYEGRNLSVGQRQLICVARAILAKPKILVMDEATSSVDAETDTLIQSLLQEEFAGITVLCIAHRLHTVAAFDRIVVMSKGNIIETGVPSELLKNPESDFYSLVAGSGEAEKKKIFETANF